jgi:hypothetical protein
LALLTFSLPSSAWDGSVSGKISVVEITNGSNLGFRVWLSDVHAAFCTSGPNWGFLYETDSNYKTYVAALLMAKALGNQVTLYLTTEGGYCHIGHITVGT